MSLRIVDRCLQSQARMNISPTKKENQKICHFTTVHHRYDTRIFIKECRSLAKNGFDVSLIVADGKGDETKDGIKIIDIGRPKNRFNRIFFSTRKAFKKALELNVGVYHFHDPELMLTGYFLQKKAKKVVFDIHENVGEQLMIREWIPYPFRKTLAWSFDRLESFFCKKYNALIVPQPIMKNKFLALNTNTFLVENFPFFNSNKISNTEANTSSEVICFHAGSLVEERGIKNMINAFDHLGPQYQLHLAGAISQELLETCQKLKGWNKTTYHGKIHFDEVLKIYKKTSIGLILYNNVGQYYLSYAVKLFEYMSYGIPVIMPDFGEWIGFNQENECGINVDPTNAEAVANAIAYLKNNPEEALRMGNNGYRAITEKYNWESAKNRLLKCYKTNLND